MHHRPQNLGKKKAEMQKKGRKYIFNFEIHKKNISKMEKRKHIYLDFFRFYIPCAFFFHFKPKNSYKKDKNAKKKHKNFFKLQK